MDEFVAIKDIRRKKLNRDIQNFKIENPNYEIYNISGYYDGGGGVRYSVIWRLKGGDNQWNAITPSFNEIYWGVNNHKNTSNIVNITKNIPKITHAIVFKLIILLKIYFYPGILRIFYFFNLLKLFQNFLDKYLKVWIFMFNYYL